MALFIDYFMCHDRLIKIDDLINVEPKGAFSLPFATRMLILFQHLFLFEKVSQLIMNCLFQNPCKFALYA